MLPLSALDYRVHCSRSTCHHRPGLYLHRAPEFCYLETSEAMSATEAETQVATTTKKAKKLKPARKQVKPGEVEKKEAPQTGKEYSEHLSKFILIMDVT